MRRALMWLNPYGREAVRLKLKNGLKTQKMHFFPCFRPYVGQPHGHIGWVTSMLFASINFTNPRTHPAQFRKKILRIDRLAKWGFLSRQFWIFFFGFFFGFFFLLNPMKSSQRFLDSKDGSKFWWLPWFPAHEVLDEHLCTGL